jgi:hypothetical protein
MPVIDERRPCQFCSHESHGTEKCARCGCRGKKRWWQNLADSVGNALGEMKFGG